MATNSPERQSRNQRLLEMPRKKAHGEHGKISSVFSVQNSVAKIFASVRKIGLLLVRISLKPHPVHEWSCGNFHSEYAECRRRRKPCVIQ
jgi:hypothetical protein